MIRSSQSMPAIKLTLLTALLVCVTSTINLQAQDYDYSWMRMVTFDQEMVNNDMAVYSDDQGNTYSTFTFQWDIHLGRPPKKKKDPEPPLLSAGNALYGLYIDKRKSDGDQAWAKVITMGDPNQADQYIAFFNKCADVAVSSNGDIYLTGSFDSSIDFGNGVTLTSDGRTDMFIAKLNGSGDAQWAIRAGGSGNEFAEADPGGTSVTLDNSGNAYVTGVLNAYPNGGGTLGSDPLDLSKDGAQAVLIKLSADGKSKWVKKAAPGTLLPNSDLGVDDAGNIYISGSAQFAVDWGGNQTPANGLRDAFISKLDNDGNHVWTKVWGFGSGPFDGKTMDNENLHTANVAPDGSVVVMLTLYDGAKIGDLTADSGKSNPTGLSPIVVSLGPDGSVGKSLVFEGDILNVPGYGISGNKGELYFQLGNKGKIVDQKTKGGGFYSFNTDGELSQMLKIGIKDLAGIHTFMNKGMAVTSEGDLFAIGNVILTSELLAMTSRNVGKRFQKQVDKNYFYDKDFNQGVVFVKYGGK